MIIRIWRALLDVIRWNHAEREMDEELQSHLERQIEHNMAQGMDAEEARYAALRLFGGMERLKEQCRDVRGVNFIETITQDLRYGLRQLRRNPGFTAVAVITLALGIGANTAIFSVVNGVLLKPLPYPHPKQLVAVSYTAPAIHLAHLGMAASMYFVYREESRTFEDIGLYYNDSVSITGMAEPERVRALDMTDGLLPILGARPILGRLFASADDSPDSPDTVILTYGYWQHAFGGDRSVIGKTIDVDGTPQEIIGVLSRRFRFLDEPKPALILPIKLDRAKTTLGSFGNDGIARLKPGVTLAQANADVARMLPIVARSFPPPPRFTLKMYESSRIEPNLRPLKEEVVGNVSKVLWILMGGIGLVLLIACANVANLLLVRVEGRQQELAIRGALGASPSRIAAQLLLESLTLSLLGGALGVAFAYGALRVPRAPRGED